MCSCLASIAASPPHCRMCTIQMRLATVVVNRIRAIRLLSVSIFSSLHIECIRLSAGMSASPGRNSSDIYSISQKADSNSPSYNYYFKVCVCFFAVSSAFICNFQISGARCRNVRAQFHEFQASQSGQTELEFTGQQPPLQAQLDSLQGGHEIVLCKVRKKSFYFN